ncbi:hypothetical protein ABMA28_001746 [Loxostege sticticalis]|uniref:Uncharacterized protein n=1 Tax=Loxostege sticticalis TaxID=481309 RepID=A0ABD0T2S8_LOXSC
MNQVDKCIDKKGSGSTCGWSSSPEVSHLAGGAEALAGSGGVAYLWWWGGACACGAVGALAAWCRRRRRRPRRPPPPPRPPPRALAARLADHPLQDTV